MPWWSCLGALGGVEGVDVGGEAEALEDEAGPGDHRKRRVTQPRHPAQLKKGDTSWHQKRKAGGSRPTTASTRHQTSQSLKDRGPSRPSRGPGIYTHRKGFDGESTLAHLEVWVLPHRTLGLVRIPFKVERPGDDLTPLPDPLLSTHVQGGREGQRELVPHLQGGVRGGAAIRNTWDGKGAVAEGGARRDTDARGSIP